MSARIQDHTDDMAPAVRDFNRRLKEKGVRYQFPPSPSSHWLPHEGKVLPYMENFLYVQDGSTVRGAYILKHQDFLIRNEPAHLAFIGLPVSEGIIDKAHTMVGVQLMVDAARRCPLLFGLGIGSVNEAAAQMFIRSKWQVGLVPFWFKVLHPARFLRNIRYLRRTPFRRFALDLLAFSGIGWVGITAYQRARTRARPCPGATCQVVPEFGPWADDVWNSSRAHYSLVAVRDARVLNRLYRRYATDSPDFLRLKIELEGRAIGWAVALNTPWADHNYFGSVRLGSIVDCLALPEHAGLVVGLATDHLAKAGADLIISNQAHAAWSAALRDQGFLQGPSNFLFCGSPPLMKRLGPLDVGQYHLNRGDGDGPIHL